MLSGAVQPDRAAHIDVASPNPTGFPWSATGQALELDKTPNNAVKVRQCRLYNIISHRYDRFRFPGLSAACLESGYRGQSLVDVEGNEFFPCPPLEHSPNSVQRAD